MCNVLICDDASFMRSMLKNILTNAGLNVVGEASNGKDAVSLYQSLKPDVVTMDITMPEMNGIDAVNSIMQIDPNAKVIMCSAMGQQSMVLDAVKAGAKDFIVKPFEAAKVIEAIKKAAKA